MELELWSSYSVLFGVLSVTVVVLLTFAIRFDKKQQKKSWEVVRQAQSHMEIEPIFLNLPNFRQAGGKELTAMDGRKVRDGVLFRSSRTDFLTEKEKGVFDELGIRAIIDLRRTKEYKTAEGDKVLDDMYDPCVVKKGKVKDYKSKGKNGTDSTDGYRGRRFLVNMMTMDLIWYVFKQVNFFVRYISLILLLVDWLFGCHLFIRLFNWMVVNRQTLSQQYVDMLEYTKPAVADIMRLIIAGTNTPVLIHCAHGKDRTGVIIAVILGCLGVDDETIAQDYAQSEAGLAPIRERLYKETVGRYGFRKEFTRAEAETMREVLREIKKRYGSISMYLESAGFSVKEQDQLREIFLEPETEQ